MNWLNLSNRYLNLAHVAHAVPCYSGACPETRKVYDVEIFMVNGDTFTLRGADAEALLIALEEECK